MFCSQEPLKFDPMRFKRPYQNPGLKDWAGYNPDLISGLYPNEVTSDFAFIPFGAGARAQVHVVEMTDVYVVKEEPATTIVSRVTPC